MESTIARPRRLVLPAILLLAGAAICAGIGRPFSNPTYSCSGMIHVKPTTSPILFTGVNASDKIPYDGYVATQQMLITSQGVIDAALVQPTWRDTGRDNSPATTDSFRKDLDVSRDGEMIVVTFRDIDPNIASAGVRSLIASYTDMYINNDAMNSAHQLKQLEYLRDTYSARIKTQNDGLFQITSGIGTEALHARYLFKVQEQNAAESAWRQARRDLMEWKTLNAAVGAPATMSPTDIIKGKTLELREEQAKDEYDQLNEEARSLGKQMAEVQSAELDLDDTKSWLDATKVKIEQISVEAAQSGRITIISNGDRPIPHATSWSAILPAIYSFCFLLTWSGWPRPQATEKPAA